MIYISKNHKISLSCLFKANTVDINILFLYYSSTKFSLEVSLHAMYLCWTPKLQTLLKHDMITLHLQQVKTKFHHTIPCFATSLRVCLFDFLHLKVENAF